ncbi:hypothetical protein OIO90_000148 [Microbotryomycetes sp. JL221]|nr:hypothetical protein OIO90_000148 [Microbotryomycetes sp. JL221]
MTENANLRSQLQQQQPYAQHQPPTALVSNRQAGARPASALAKRQPSVTSSVDQYHQPPKRLSLSPESHPPLLQARHSTSSRSNQSSEKRLREQISGYAYDSEPSASRVGQHEFLFQSEPGAYPSASGGHQANQHPVNKQAVHRRIPTPVQLGREYTATVSPLNVRPASAFTSRDMRSKAHPPVASVRRPFHAVPTPLQRGGTPRR